MSGEHPADPYSHWRRRAETAEAELARLNMEMEAYRQKCTPKDVEAMTAVIKALNEEKAARARFPDNDPAGNVARLVASGEMSEEEARKRGWEPSSTPSGETGNG